MPQQITCCFYGEGNSDAAFFAPLLEKILSNLVPYYDTTVEVYKRQEMEADTAKGRFLEISQKTAHAGILIYHLDADAPSAEPAFSERFEPYLADAKKRPATEYNHDIVPIIPVRNLEAWIFADFEALQSATTTRHGCNATELGFPEYPRMVEAITDPRSNLKKVLQSLYGRRKAPDIEGIFPIVALALNLSRLEQVPAYLEFLTRLKATLTDLHYLNG